MSLKKKRSKLSLHLKSQQKKYKKAKRSVRKKRFSQSQRSKKRQGLNKRRNLSLSNINLSQRKLRLYKKNLSPNPKARSLNQLKNSPQTPQSLTKMASKPKNPKQTPQSKSNPFPKPLNRLILSQKSNRPKTNPTAPQTPQKTLYSTNSTTTNPSTINQS